MDVIAQENLALYQRLQAIKPSPVVNRDKLTRAFQKNMSASMNMRKFQGSTSFAAARARDSDDLDDGDAIAEEGATASSNAGRATLGRGASRKISSIAGKDSFRAGRASAAAPAVDVSEALEGSAVTETAEPPAPENDYADDTPSSPTAEPVTDE